MASKSSLPMVSSDVSERRSIDAVKELLRSMGCSKIAEFEESGIVKVMAVVQGTGMVFAPNETGVYQTLKKHHNPKRNWNEQAQRGKAGIIAWRLLYYQVKNSHDMMVYNAASIEELFAGRMLVGPEGGGQPVQLSQIVAENRKSGKMSMNILQLPNNSSTD